MYIPSGLLQLNNGNSIYIPVDKVNYTINFNSPSL